MYLSEGQTFKARDNGLWVVISVVPQADQITLRTGSGFTRTETLTAFQKHVVEGDYRDLSGKSASDANKPPPAVALTEAQKHILAYRKPIIDFVRAKQSEAWGWPELERELQHRAEIFGPPPSRRTLQRWLADAKHGSYEPGKPGWRKGCRRIPAELFGAVEAVIAWAARNGTRELFNLETMRRLVAEELGKRRSAALEAKPERVSRGAVKEVLATRAAWGDDLKTYLSRRAYRALTRKATKIMDASRPLELVEIDALIPEFHVFDALGNDLGQPTIYCSIDVATAHVVGIKAYAMSPGIEPLLDFLEHMFFPKAARPNGLEPPWGRPERILSDLGPEFRSAFTAMVFHALLIEHLLAEGEAGWKKPHIERLFGCVFQPIMDDISG